MADRYVLRDDQIFAYVPRRSTVPTARLKINTKAEAQYRIDEAIAERMAWYECALRSGDAAALSREQLALQLGRPTQQTAFTH